MEIKKLKSRENDSLHQWAKIIYFTFEHFKEMIRNLSIYVIMDQFSGLVMKHFSELVRLSFSSYSGACSYNFNVIFWSYFSMDGSTLYKSISSAGCCCWSCCSQPISMYSWMITQIHRSVELDKLECLFTRLSASYSVGLKLNCLKANCVTT